MLGECRGCLNGWRVSLVVVVVWSVYILSIDMPFSTPSCMRMRMRVQWLPRARV